MFRVFMDKETGEYCLSQIIGCEIDIKRFDDYRNFTARLKRLMEDEAQENTAVAIAREEITGKERRTSSSEIPFTDRRRAHIGN